MTPGFEPRPSWRCSRSKPNARDDRVGRRAGGDDDALARVAPGRGQGGERVEVRGVVGADDQQRHEAAHDRRAPRPRRVRHRRRSRQDAAIVSMLNRSRTRPLGPLGPGGRLRARRRGRARRAYGAREAVGRRVSARTPGDTVARRRWPGRRLRAPRRRARTAIASRIAMPNSSLRLAAHVDAARRAPGPAARSAPREPARRHGVRAVTRRAADPRRRPSAAGTTASMRASCSRSSADGCSRSPPTIEQVAALARAGRRRPGLHEGRHALDRVQPPD